MWERMPNEDRFDAKFAAGTPLLEAVESLCLKTDHTIDEMERLSMGQVYQLAVEQYGDELSDFWKNWATWNTDQSQPMGDL